MEIIKTNILGKLLLTLRQGIGTVIEYLKGSDFFTAPASTKFHGNTEGGLAKHSWEVYQRLAKMKADDKRIGIPDESIVLCALLHDVCKIDLYKANILKSGKVSTKIPYKAYDLFPMGHGEKSVAILLDLGLRLSQNEQLMIRWHMGPFDKAFYNHQAKIEQYGKDGLYLFLADYYETLMGN